MKKTILILILFLIAGITKGQTYPIIEEFNSGTTWSYTNGAGLQNYGGAENYATFNIGSTPYPNNSNITIISPIYSFANCGSSLTISFPITGRIENGFDFVYFQYYDGVWNTQATFTSVQNSTPSYSIPNTATQFRFLLVTDCSVNGYKGGNPSCNLTVGTCTPIVGNCSGLTSVYYYDITRFTINCVTPLPIELIKFTGSSIKEGNNIYWITASETNNSLFVIEKSRDAINFETLGIESGAGNSSTLLNYSLIDTNPYETTYYRLKQVDYDGKETYSNIIAVNQNKKEVKVVKITNILGQEVGEDYEGVRVIQYSDGSVIKKVGK
jgi:hypothetical protein